MWKLVNRFNYKWRSLIQIMLLVGMLSTLFSLSGMANPQVHHWKHYVAAKSFYDAGKHANAVHEMDHAIAQEKKNASYYLLRARANEKLSRFQQASSDYYSSAELYKKSDYNAYLANKAKGDALATQIEVYSYESTTPSATKLAKFEPIDGLYIGAFVEYDAAIGPRNVKKFNELSGKQHAIYFTYYPYGQPFPINWANQVKEAGGAIQLAFEPQVGLANVKDDEYLRTFARACKAFGAPIFMRFAAEMNGAWTKWNGNPALYIQKFRLIADVMREEAPNVAMLWTPNSNPQKEIDRYYPGDQWVDWVGVNMYSVRYFNGDAKQPADQVNPLDLLDYVYKTYAARKPIMIAEYGATHFTRVGNTDTTQFSINKMNMLYHGVKMKYPRLKGINWFSVNTLERNENPERKLNNFSLTANNKVMNAYKSMIRDPYFLANVVVRPTTVSPVSNAQPKRMFALANRTVKGTLEGYAWVKTYDPYINRVEYRLNGSRLSTAVQYPFAFTVDTRKLQTGTHKLSLTVFDSKNRKAAERTISFKVAR